MKVKKQDLIKIGLDVIETEARAVTNLASRIDEKFIQACELLYNCQGRIVVTGMGKSGHIGKKTAATLASTGTPAFFVHPAEALHGDLGMITANDVVIAFSNSGETEEILQLLPVIKRLGAPLIALTGNEYSALSNAAAIHIDVSVDNEACSLGLAPTASTTAALAMGDALAIALLNAKGFTADDFARSHPGGKLGRRLLLKISDIMHKENNIPSVAHDASLSDALVEMSAKRLGMTTILKDHDPKQMIGIFTDGDLRRALDSGIDFYKAKVDAVMTTQFKRIQADQLAADALYTMQKFKINALPVVDENNTLIGALNMHDLLQAGVL